LFELQAFVSGPLFFPLGIVGFANVEETDGKAETLSLPRDEANGIEKDMFLELWN
jgi:hypothetical protein